LYFILIDINIYIYFFYYILKFQHYFYTNNITIIFLFSHYVCIM